MYDIQNGTKLGMGTGNPGVSRRLPRPVPSTNLYT